MEGTANEIREMYYCRCASAYVRGRQEKISGTLTEPNLRVSAYGRGRKEGAGRERREALCSEEAEGSPEGEDLVLQGIREGLKMYRFKKSHGKLPRVRRVLGFLRSVPFESLLDVGSGRGAFLIPFLEHFPHVSVTAEDLLPERVEFLETLRRGGIRNLTVRKADICMRPLPEKSVDIVTLLEVLEHIPRVEEAVKAAVETARKHVVVTVPSKEDSNPEHIHLLTKERLTALFEAAGCSRLRFDGVQGHLFMVATI